MEKILVDENGYKQFMDELEKLKQQSINNSITGSEEYKDAVGDGWHDNFAFEQSMRESRLIAKKLDDIFEKKKHLEIIKEKSRPNNVVNIGDKIILEIKYSDDDIETETIILTGNYIPDPIKDIKEITLNSPIGKAIYKAKVGKMVSYNVNGTIVEVKIISKEI